MIRRFRRPQPTPAITTTKNCGSGAECPCCSAIRRARASQLFDPLPEYSSPLTPGVQRVNVSRSEDGRNLLVDLSTDWARMVGQLTLVGKGMVMTRNAAAILGRRMAYPPLNVTSGGGKGASGNGGLWLDFRQLGSARALHVRRETGHVFGVEFTDGEGQIVHRFTLTPESGMDEFFAWVRLHQACTAHQTVRRFEEEDTAAIPAQTMRQCDGGALVLVLAACQSRSMSVRATVRGAAATQRAEFVPGSLEPDDEWWFTSDEGTGLHFQPALFSRVTLEQQQGLDNDRGRVTLRAALGDGTTALTLEAGCPSAEADWKTVLEATA